MAKILEPIADDAIKKMTLANLKKEYIKLAELYRRIINLDVVYCPHCGDWKASNAFYSSSKSPDCIEHYACKECILDMCTNYDKKTKIRTDNKQKSIDTFKKLDWYFNEQTYNEQVVSINEATNDRNKGTAIQQWIVMCRSLPQYRGKTFSHSEFLFDGETLEVTSNRKPRKEIIKLFGSGLSIEDYLYLQDQYDDWRSRTQVDSKSQETYIVRICYKLLDIWKAQKAGKDTKELDKTLNDLMAASKLQPRQTVDNSSNDTLTLGQLIEKWENEKPIPEPDPEFQDVDGIMKYINVFFKGHLAKMMGLKNAFSDEYDEYMEQYTAKKPSYDEDEGSEAIFNSLFGKEVE